MADALTNEDSRSPTCNFMRCQSPSSERWHSSSLHPTLRFPCFISRMEDTDIFHPCLEDLGPSANFTIRLWCGDCCWDRNRSCTAWLLSLRRAQGLIKMCRICWTLVLQITLLLNISKWFIRKRSYLINLFCPSVQILRLRGWGAHWER